MKRTAILKNRNQETIEIMFREAKLGEEDAIITCIRDEYQDTYFKTDFYDPAYIRKCLNGSEIRFMVAEDIINGNIAGIMILKEFKPYEDMVELATQIFMHAYRGFHMAEEFIKFELEYVKDREYSAIYVLPVTFHEISQKLIQRQGFVATGFIMSVFDMEQIIQSYDRDEKIREGQGIQIRSNRKKDAGILYIPLELIDFTNQIYKRLNVNYEIRTDIGKNENKCEESKIRIKSNSIQKFVEITVSEIGTDLISQVHNIFSIYGKDMFYNIFLNCNDDHIIKCYEDFKKEGFFFTGLKPLCSEKEYLVMHRGKNAQLELDHYVLDEEFQEIRAEIRKFVIDN